MLPHSILTAVEAAMLRAEDGEFGGERRPAGTAIVEIVDEPDVLQAVLFRLVENPAHLVTETSRGAVDAVVQR